MRSEIPNPPRSVSHGTWHMVRHKDVGECSERLALSEPRCSSGDPSCWTGQLFLYKVGQGFWAERALRPFQAWSTTACDGSWLELCGPQEPQVLGLGLSKVLLGLEEIKALWACLLSRTKGLG